VRQLEGTGKNKLLGRNVKRFRGGLVFKTLRLCVSLNSRLESNKEEEGEDRCGRCLELPHFEAVRAATHLELPHLIRALRGGLSEAVRGRGGPLWEVKRFRGGLVFKAHRLLYHSTLGLRVIKKKKGRTVVGGEGEDMVPPAIPRPERVIPFDLFRV